MNNLLAVLTVLSIALAPSVALAAAHVELTDSAAVLVTRDAASVAVPVHGTVQPGQRIRYTIVARNSGDRPAAQLMPVANIPAGERFVAGSAGASAEYSIDNGKTWSRRPMVTVTNPGGTTTTRPALPAQYNAVRWTGALPLAPGARATFAYDVIVE